MGAKENHIFAQTVLTKPIEIVIIMPHIVYVINIEKSNVQLLFFPVIWKFVNFSYTCAKFASSVASDRHSTGNTSSPRSWDKLELV